MENLRTITYDDKTTGRKVLAFPLELPFAPYLEQFKKVAASDKNRERLFELSNTGNIYSRADALAEYLYRAEEPHVELLRIAALAASRELAGLKLLYSVLLAIPPIETLIDELSDFASVRRLMERISRKEASGEKLRESEQWFRKKVQLLSMSHPLPNSPTTSEREPWRGWSEGVRRALDDPDRRWENAVLERAKVELEALDLRVKMIVASLDPDSKSNLVVYLGALNEENKWRLKAIEEAHEQFGGATLIISRRLGNRWGDVMTSLRQSDAGSLLAGLFDAQMSKAHPHSQVMVGAAVLRAL
ncbi:MAG: hypothetical protein KAX38_03140, partial [Candidatus Krumholzibacteria bacterium]|nr:hypothetical protein [Candidatus Krumholzibacteria bacterium]